jgi:hypothetical protein
VQIELAAEALPSIAQPTLHTTWLGTPQTVVLRDDGRLPDRRAGDGTWTAQLVGEEVRTLSIQLQIDDAVLWSGTETLPMGAQTLRFAHDVRGPRAWRSAVALPVPAMEVAEASSVAAMLGWAGLVMVWLMGLAGRRGRR